MPWITESVLARLRERLGLSEIRLSPQDLPLVEAGIITVSADAAREESAMKSDNTGSQSAGASGSVVLFTVPDGIRLRPRIIVIRRTAGDNTWNDLYLDDVSEGVKGIIYKVASGQTHLNVPVEAIPDIMDAGDELEIVLDGAGASASTFSCGIYGLVEELQ